MNCSDLLDMRNLQEQVKKSFCYEKFFWPFTVWINCPSDLKIFANSWPSASNFKQFSRSLEQFLITVGQNNFGNKIPLSTKCSCSHQLGKQETYIWKNLKKWFSISSHWLLFDSQLFYFDGKIHNKFITNFIPATRFK
jgi:hypothetical protein